MSIAGKKAKLDVKTSLNYELAEMLSQLADYEKNVNRAIHKYNAYRKAARSINDYNKKIESEDDAKHLVTFFLF
jgi:DNA polymerase beta